MAEIEGAIDVSFSPFLLFLSARLTREPGALSGRASELGYRLTVFLIN
jgi:hypothetical protein